jgi:Cupin domain
MSTTGVVVQPGRAKRVELCGSWLNYLVTGRDSKGCSVFEFEVAPGFDTGVHYHTRIEEFFYVLEGELDRKRLSNTPVRQAGAVLKCLDAHKNRVISTQATYPCGSSGVGG